MNTAVHNAEITRLRDVSWIQTASGKAFHPLDPRPEDVDIYDIAHALGNKCRFTGHSHHFYSVAEHCVRASRIVPEEYALAALLHDAGEAYLPDVAPPTKRSVYVHLPGDAPGRFHPFVVAEATILDVIFEGLDVEGLELTYSAEVKTADLVLLATEVRDLMGGERGGKWGLTHAPLPEKIYPWGPAVAKTAFLARFTALARRVKR